MPYLLETTLISAINISVRADLDAFPAEQWGSDSKARLLPSAAPIGIPLLIQ